MLCPLCQTRKARRHCPALGRQICSVCCGTKRLTEIACPSDCVYLASAKAHPAALLKRQRERDGSAILRLLHGLTETQYHLFLFLLPVVARQRGVDLVAVSDDDIADGAASLAATYETASRGVIYEHRATTLPAQRFATAVAEHLKEPLKNAPSSLERDLAIVLRRLERAARDVRKALGEGHTAFLDLAGRLASPEHVTSPEEMRSEPRLIVPGS
ncbi:MAG: hypothetical protein HY654_02500 [Acidobacteria bacterium]|nr:hypothetical protein [Acidobacteriota bacterium]